MQYLNPARCALVLLIFALAFTGCDSVDSSEDVPDPYAEMELGAPLNMTIQGNAALGGSDAFSDEAAFFLPIGNSGYTLTAIQLFGEDEGSAHTLSFTYIGEDALSEGSYDVGFDLPCDDPSDCRRPGLFFGGDRLMTNYIRTDDDSLRSYMLSDGTLTVEQASDESIAGTFALEADAEISVSIDDLEAFQDSLRANRPTPGAPRDLGDLPEPPPFTVQPLEPAMTIEGSFAATPGEFPRRPGATFGWMMQGGVFSTAQ
jgi:hypothetical protein